MMNTRTVLLAAVVFAIAMGALEHGGWWWLWLGIAVVGMKGIRVPGLGGVKLSASARYILRENRRVRSHTRAVARAQRRARRLQHRNSRRSG